MSAEKEHPIAVVERRTGLSGHVIRKWEERYNAVEPSRNSAGRRLYSEQDIDRLILLTQALETGRSIGQIAHIDDEKLRKFIRADIPVHGPGRHENRENREDLDIEALIEDYIESLQRLDGRDLRMKLARVSLDLGHIVVIDHFIPELMAKIGDYWQEGKLRIIHEHLVSEVVRAYLIKALESAALPSSAPVALSTTTADQNHDLGSLAAAVVAATSGWNAVFIGANTPLEEIVAAACATGAAIVLLSYTYPSSREKITADIASLKNTLPKNTGIIIGGDPTQSLDPAIYGAGVMVIRDFASLRGKLVELSRR